MFSLLQMLTTYFVTHFSTFSKTSPGFLLPAKAGLTGLDPFRFFTGTVGTLWKERAEHYGFNKWDKMSQWWDLKISPSEELPFLTETNCPN